MLTYNDIFGWFNDQGQQLYNEVITKCPENSHFVEIGCFMGRSTVCMAQLIKSHNKSIKFDAVDHFKGSDEHYELLQNKSLFDIFKQNMIDAEVIDLVNVFPLDSVSASKLYEDNSLDFVFIDAAHDYKSVILDIQHWLPKVKINGILAGDDYLPKLFPGVVRAVDEMFGPTRKTGHYWVHWKTIENWENFYVVNEQEKN